LRTTTDQVDRKVLDLMSERDAQQKEIERLRRDLAMRDVEALLQRVQVVDGISILAAQVEAANADMLREIGDWLKDKLGSGIVVLGAAIADKPSLVVMVTQDLTRQGYDAVQIIRPIARIVGGGGGGRATMAQAGGKDADRLPEALAHAPSLIAKK
jgi:alanyl-tRNA synthetase